MSARTTKGVLEEYAERRWNRTCVLVDHWLAGKEQFIDNASVFVLTRLCELDAAGQQPNGGMALAESLARPGPTPGPDPLVCADLPALRARWAEVEQVQAAFLDHMREAALGRFSSKARREELHRMSGIVLLGRR